MKEALITMIVFYIIIALLGGNLGSLIFPGGNVEQSYIKPIYLGIIFLSGLIVGCTMYLAELIKEHVNKV